MPKKCVRETVGTALLGSLAIGLASACSATTTATTVDGAASGGRRGGPLAMVWRRAVPESVEQFGADPGAPLALAQGVNGALYVQWNAATPAANRGASLSQLSAVGQWVSWPVPGPLGGWRTGRSTAVPSCVVTGRPATDLPILAANQPQNNAPDLTVTDATLGTHDFSQGSTFGALIPAGGARTFLAARYNPWTSENPSTRTSDAYLMVTTLRAVVVDEATQTCAVENDVYPAQSDGYTKGRLVTLPGVPFDFNVGAAARLGTDGIVVAGSDGAGGGGWIVSLDSTFTPVHQGAIPGVPLRSTTVASVAIDASGRVFACGTSTVPPGPREGRPAQHPTTDGWIAQAAPDLTGWTRLDLPLLSVDGCTLSEAGAVLVSGTYAGTFDGQTSEDRDGFLAQVTPGNAAGAPTLASFLRFGSAASEPIVSAPLVTGGYVYVAGVSQGDYAGAGAVPGHSEVFLARF